MSAYDQLTDKQKIFIDKLTEGASQKEAALAAGYSEKICSYTFISKSPKVTEALRERADVILRSDGIRAASALGTIVRDPTQAGAKNKIAAAAAILDRIGLGKEERVNVTTGENQALFFFPAKQKKEDLAGGEEDGKE